MNTPALDDFLISDDATGAASTSPTGRPAETTGHTPDPGAGNPNAAESLFDPGRWVMVGWRDAKGAPLVTWQQLTAILSGPQGPCARCATLHHRYGAGGQPLCPDCRAAAHRP